MGQVNMPTGQPNEQDLMMGTRWRDAAIMYDTFIISKDLAGLKMNADVSQYSDLFTRDKIPFFTDQNHTRASMGEAYSGQDVQTLMQTGFDVFSMGIGFFPPCTSTPDEIANPEEAMAATIFANEFPKHIGLIMKVRESERLVVPSIMTPAGTGAGGIMMSTDFPDSLTAHMSGVGHPALHNRFIFPEKMLLRKDDYVSITLILSTYAKALIAQLPGPFEYAFKKPDGTPFVPAIPKRAIIQCTLMGCRAKPII